MNNPQQYQQQYQQYQQQQQPYQQQQRIQYTEPLRFMNGTAIYNLLNNDDVEVVGKKENFYIIQWKRDLSVNYLSAMNSYFASKMNIHRRQLLIQINNNYCNGIHLQPGAMQMMFGGVEAKTNIKGAGDLFSKTIRGAVTGESAIKAEYYSNGSDAWILCEPTYRHLILIDVMKDFNGNVVLDDGLYLASSNTIEQRAIARSNISSAVAGGEGLFNLSCQGKGIVALESFVPQEELIVVDLNNDVLKIDGNMAIAWSGSLSFTVERSSRTLIGSAASGEGLVNVYRGTGRVLVAPVRDSQLGSLGGIQQI